MGFTQKGMDDYYQAVADNVKRTGLHIQYVFDHQCEKPDFLYTIGLKDRLGYELIAFGLGRSHAYVMNVIAEATKEKSLVMDVPDTDFFNMPVKFRRCDPELVAEYGVQAFQFHKDDTVKFVQLVLCDKEGRFPEDEGFDVKYMSPRQKVLYKLPN